MLASMNPHELGEKWLRYLESLGHGGIPSGSTISTSTAMLLLARR